jgi:hypothetical protein
MRRRGWGQKSEEEAGTKGIKEINAEVRKLLSRKQKGGFTLRPYL